MHCVLVGPGALGCLFSFYLARGIGRNDSLQLLDYNQDRGEMLNRQGLFCTHDGAERHAVVEVRSNPADIRLADVVLLCVKSYDLSSCLERCKPFLKDDSLVIFMQNGIGQLSYGEVLEKGIPVFGTTSEGANLTAPGKVIHAGVGETFFGGTAVSSTIENRLDHLSGILERSGLLVQQVDDIVDRLWAKLMVNVGINGLTAINGCPNGDLLLEKSLQGLMDDAVDEAAMVAEHNGVLFEFPPLQLCHDVCRRTAENISSMLQDVRKKRKTEIDSINGVIVSEGIRLGIGTPVNAMIVEKVKKIEQSYTK